jgi:transcriptional regulator
LGGEEGDAVVLDDETAKLDILRQQVADMQPDVSVADPSAHARRLAGIRDLRLEIREVTAKFKYGGNVDAEHRLAVAARLADRDGLGDAAAHEHLLRRNAGMQ